MAILASDLLLTLGQKITTVIRGDTYNVCIRGWLANQYILTDVPKVQGQAIRVAPQTGCSVRFIKDGVVIMFNTFIEYVYSQTISFMIIEYPAKYEKIKLRKFERIKVNFAATYTQGSDAESPVETATMRDLSLGGALMGHLKPLVKDAKLSITLKVNGTAENVDAIVRNVRKNPKSEKEPFVSGIKFVNMSDSANNVLTEFLKTQAVSPRSTSKS